MFCFLNVRELLETSIHVSTLGLCIFDMQRSRIMGAGHIWGREEDPHPLWSLGSHPSQLAEGEQRITCSGPRVPDRLGSDIIKLWWLPSFWFILPLRPHATVANIVEMSSTLNMSLPLPALPVLSPPTGPFPHPHGLGAKITLESLLLVDSFSLHKYIIYILYIIFETFCLFVSTVM